MSTYTGISRYSRQILAVHPEQCTNAITTIKPKSRPQVTPEIRKRGRRNIRIQKYMFQVFIVAANGFGIFATWWFPQYWYLLLPFISAAVMMNIAMIITLLFNLLYYSCCPEKQLITESPESLVFLIPCYNETRDEMERSLNSLITQKGVSEHQRCIMIICDGKVRGPGMEKTTGEYLFEDILTQRDYRIRIPRAYLAWDQQFMDIEVQRGTYHGVPYFCIVKLQNQGKRDSLIAVRSFLYNYNIRHLYPETIFASTFFSHLAAFIKESGMDAVDHLIGMDADTVFDDHCISELLRGSRYKNTVGVCGYVAVDWKDNSWHPWRLYQSAEYTIAQCLRRLHQSVITHKVSCLPGCCQLLKICEETCGSEVLLERFGYCPIPTDGILRHIRATASEDRNHVCHMLSARPKAQTRQALHAVAYTDVPQTWSVFLSQRRRWTLGATSNDLFLSFAPGVQWFERILACTNVVTWFLNVFIFASMGRFILAMFYVKAWIIFCFIAIALIPIVYYAMIPFWHCKQWHDCFRFWIGCIIYIVCGPFINVAILLYSCHYVDSFGWGKTRQVVSEDIRDGAGQATEETPLILHT
ncbi:chitin synthase-domain-containing protein [Aspergillus bertholletiae]|uniref:chitin synthase n=1 Tax=Aspergillus bertholletiae TaxID=1226010 RepID=A0A5N7APY1_9EURO|nr:chitin synthase-domain-containing protein [Aspergillus bertholletiae]